MKTNKTFNPSAKNILLSLLLVCTLLFSSLGIVSLSSLNKASADGYPFRYDNSVGDDHKMEKYYTARWQIGQDQRAGDEASGKWSFGRAILHTDSQTYVYEKAEHTDPSLDAGDTARYKAGSGPHQLRYGFDLITDVYSGNTSTAYQSVFAWTAEDKGTVKFTGFFSRKNSEATSNITEMVKSQGVFSDFWIPGINTGGAGNGFTSGEYYTVGMFKYSPNASGNKLTCLDYESYDSEYVWVVDPTKSYEVEVGDIIFFGVLCTNKGQLSDGWSTATIGLFSSEFTMDDEDSGAVVDPPVDDPNKDLPDTLEDITAPSTGFNEIAHYKFDDSANLGKDSLGNYDLENKDLTLGANGVTLDGNSSTPKFLYAKKLAKDGSDFSDAVKGSFSLSFKIYAKQGKEGDGDHVIFSTGDGTDGFEVLWSTTDLVVKAGGQEYRIDNAYVKNDLGEDEQVFMLDSKASWYRYTIVYDETNAEDIQLRIRVDRFNDEGTMYGNMTVKTIKRLKSKIVFGGNMDYSFTIGANSTFGTYGQNYARGYDSTNQDFSPVIADLRIYSGVVTDDEIKNVWSDDEGDNYYDRSASWQLTIENNEECGSVEGAQNIQYGDRTKLNVTVRPNTGYKIKSIKWNAGSGDVDVPVSKDGAVTTFSKTMNSDCTLKVEYEQIMYLVTVKVNGVKDVAETKKYPAMSKFQVEIKPDSGCEISSVKWNGTTINKSNFSSYNKSGFTYEDTIIGESTLEIEYVQKVFSVTFNIDGTTDTTLTKRVNANDEITISIEAPSGKKISSISYGGKSIKIDDTNKKSVEFTFKVTTATTVKVVFEEEESLFNCSSSVTSIYGVSALILLAGAFLVVKKAKKSK